jgi:hypothetical protein
LRAASPSTAAACSLPISSAIANAFGNPPPSPLSPPPLAVLLLFLLMLLVLLALQL